MGLAGAPAVELAREGVPLIVIQRQPGHSDLGIMPVYLQGIDNAEIIETVNARRQPMIPVSTARPHQDHRHCSRDRLTAPEGEAALIEKIEQHDTKLRAEGARPRRLGEDA